MLIITGASRGLGKAIFERLRKNGFEVLGLARNIEPGSDNLLCCDVGDMEQVRAISRDLRKQDKKISGLINAAGIASMNLALMTPPHIAESIIRVNLLGTIFCCQAFVPAMLKQKSGCVINFSSIAVEIGLQGESVYAASKAGVETFSRILAREVADFNIRVNCIAPGPVKTDLLKGITDTQIDKIIARQIINKRYEQSDICDLVEMLLEPKLSMLTGQIFHVGGV